MEGARLTRKFSDAFSVVSPHDGVMDSLILPRVNAHTMSLFLSTVAQRHPQDFIVMVMDQAGWHIAHGLEVPQNMRLVLLPPWSPEINPAEHIWIALRDDCVGNTVFASFDAADKALSAGLRSLESDHARMLDRVQLDNIYIFEPCEWRRIGYQCGGVKGSQPVV